jgi:histidine triad (HIT) family protein
MGETIFSKILRGDIPCHKVYEDEMVFAFLDINPLSPGHTLVIPKEATATMDKLTDESAAAIGRVLPRISRAVLKATGAQSFNILQNNGADAQQSVFHVHFHIIPKGETGLNLVPGWKPKTLEHDAGRDLAERIATAISRPDE